MIGKPHWHKPPPCPPRVWDLPFGSEERKQAARRAWIAEFGHDRCSYCGTTLEFPADSCKVRGAKGYKPNPREAQRDHDIPRRRLRCDQLLRIRCEKPYVPGEHIIWCDLEACRSGCVGEGRNIVPACRTCNTRKGAKTGAEFRAKLASEKR